MWARALKEAIEKLKSPRTMTDGGTEDFLSPGSFQKKGVASPPGIEPGTPGFLCGFGLKARCSILTELRALCGPCLSFL
jgi:hypothetical protein